MEVAFFFSSIDEEIYKYGRKETSYKREKEKAILGNCWKNYVAKKKFI